MQALPRTGKLVRDGYMMVIKALFQSSEIVYMSLTKFFFSGNIYGASERRIRVLFAWEGRGGFAANPYTTGLPGNSGPGIKNPARRVTRLSQMSEPDATFRPSAFSKNKVGHRPPLFFQSPESPANRGLQMPLCRIYLCRGSGKSTELVDYWPG